MKTEASTITINAGHRHSVHTHLTFLTGTGSRVDMGMRLHPEINKNLEPLSFNGIYITLQ